MRHSSEPNIDRFTEVLGRVSFPGFKFHALRWALGYYLQIECDGVDNVSGERLVWKSRKWILSPHMTDGEVVQTAFKAVLTALEHEAREKFKYRDVTVFDPHYDIEALVELRMRPDSIKERA